MFSGIWISSRMVASLVCMALPAGFILKISNDSHSSAGESGRVFLLVTFDRGLVTARIAYLNDRKAFPFDASQIELQDMGINQIPRPIIGGESETKSRKRALSGGFDGPERATEKAAALLTCRVTARTSA